MFKIVKGSRTKIILSKNQLTKMKLIIFILFNIILIHVISKFNYLNTHSHSP